MINFVFTTCLIAFVLYLIFPPHDPFDASHRP